MAGKPFVTRIRLADAEQCPCGTDNTYGNCCAPLHRSERQAQSATELMRARYSAYAAHEADYLWRTWHPLRRPPLITFEDDVRWTGLKIEKAEQTAERKATVEFYAHFYDEQGDGTFHEVSRFEMRGRRWMYVDGDVEIL